MPKRQQPRKRSKPKPRGGGGSGKLTPFDRKRAEKVPCPNLGRAGHGPGCRLCHGTGEIDAIK